MRLLAVVALVSLLVVCVTAERYVVVLQPGMLIPSRHTRASNIINLEIGLFVAFSADLTALELSLLSVDPIVNYIVPDADVFETACDGTQSSPLSWGQDRVDQRDATSGTYTHQTEGGAGVDVFVVDSGIDVTRPEFDGRADWPPPPYKGDFTGEGRFDGSSHGTHVAGTVGGDVYGVAKGVRIWATKVLDSEGRGSGTTLLEGLQEVHNFAKRSGRATVVNLSLGFGAVFQPADDAIAAMMEDNDRLVVVAAAGNSNVDACDTSPGRATAAVTVAATNNADRRADFSNFGSCVDIFAPGVGIASVTSVNGPGGGAVQAFQGTSMAAPHVAGAAALFFWGFPEETGLEVIQRLKNSATTGRVTDLQGSPNVLLYTGDQCDATPADETVPPGGSGDPCSPNPCKNGGTCVTTALGTDYVCECPVGFSGRHCDPNPFAMGCSGLAPGTRCEDGDHCTTSDSCSDSGECEAGIYYCPLPGTTAPVSTTGPSNGLEAALEDHFLIIIIGVGSVLVIATAGTAVYLCTQRGGRSPARGERIAVSEKKMPKGKKAEIKSWEYETSSHGVDASGSYYHDETGSAAMTGGDDTSDAGSDSPDDDSMVDESARASSIRSESELLPGRSPSMQNLVRV